MLNFPALRSRSRCPITSRTRRFGLSNKRGRLDYALNQKWKFFVDRKLLALCLAHSEDPFAAFVVYELNYLPDSRSFLLFRFDEHLKPSRFSNYMLCTGVTGSNSVCPRLVGAVVWGASGDGIAIGSAEELQYVASDLKVKAKELGLSLAFITSTKPSSRLKNYEKWLESGYNGEMAYMSRSDRMARRRDPNLILKGAQAVVMVGMPYWPGMSAFPVEHDVETLPRRSAKRSGLSVGDTGIVSCYAWGSDYHNILGSRLRTLGEWLCSKAGGVVRYYVDTGAVLERDFAERAGMGFIGKNSLLINPKIGSGLFLGALFTTVALPIDGEEGEEPRRGKAGCGKCTKCKIHCPTNAIVNDRVVDSRRCISYLTIELKGSIPIELRKDVGARIYGCDVCQQVCPWNKLEWDSGHSPLWGSVGREISTPRLTELLAMDDAKFQSRFKNSAVRRIGLERLSRNVAVALGNVGGQRELPIVMAAARSHTSQMVREHAAWAVDQIRARLHATCDKTSDIFEV